MKKYKERIVRIIDTLSKGLHERDEIVSNSLLAILSGQSVFLYGLPGTAKSLIARRLSKVFRNSKHFEYLMQRFSTPEEVFGPVSIHELKQDRFVRKIEGYMPTADFVFLDEIWKSSPAILNTLLTIINERIFRNGDTEVKVPLKGLIAASNETPPPNQGLEALYDRFTMRIMVAPMKERSNFESLVDGSPVTSDIQIDDELRFSNEEWELLQSDISNVNISKEALDIIHAIRIKIEEFNKSNPEKAVYVSDRRWQKIAVVMKTAAYLCDRKTVIPVDTLILRNCLWTLEENRTDLEHIVENAVRNFGKNNLADLERWIDEYKDLENGVNQTFFYNEDIYETKNIKGEDCIPVEFEIKLNPYNYNSQADKLRLYAPLKNLSTSNVFQLLNEEGCLEGRTKCNFGGGKTCTISIDTAAIENGWNYKRTHNVFAVHATFKPKIKNTKGTQKTVDPRTKKAFLKECQDLDQSISKLINCSKSYYLSKKKKNHTPFVPSEKIEIVMNSIKTHIEDLENHKFNAEHLLEKVDNYAITK